MEHVDTVVVGSGFGGAVSAYRLAEDGRSVVVLERGRAWPPDSFPRSPREMSRAFWDPSEDRHGLFDVWSFDRFESVVASGLGGGSLIYANVLLRKDPAWFVHADPLPGGGYETWPVTYDDLEPHYEAVEDMLTPTPYPRHAPPYSTTRKTQAMHHAARRLGLTCDTPPLAVSFAPRPGALPAKGVEIDPAPYGNVHGAARYTCDLSAECDVGCNRGAKNTLDHTYLSAADHHGAVLRTMCEVTALRARDGGGYVVDYLDRSPDGPARPRTISAERVVLGAGAFGTTRLLLRNRRGLPGLGPRVGTRFSGNGDTLAFLLPGEDGRVFDAGRGPVITSSIRRPDERDGGAAGDRGFYLQEGGYPDFVGWIAESSGPGQARRTVQFALEWLSRRLRPSEDPNMSDEFARLVGDGTLSSGSLPLLGMGRDVPDGVMSLDPHGWLDVTWNETSNRDYLRRVQELVSEVSDALGTTLRSNPLRYFRRMVTVHPLGGAPMGHDPSTGVCDAYGEVFGHPGLYVADGAAMPGPVGPNPSLTIAAHSDRVATAILSQPTARSRRVRQASGLSFRERMSGRLALGTSDPDTGDATGDPAEVELTVTIPDIDTFLSDPAHRAPVAGTVSIDELGGRFEIRHGSFSVLAPGPTAGSRRMDYRLTFEGPDGRLRTLVGRKTVRDDPGPDLWADTTTLRCRLLDGQAVHTSDEVDDTDDVHDAGGAGALRLGAADLARQLASFSPTGPDGVTALARFGSFFLGGLWAVYGPGGNGRVPDAPGPDTSDGHAGG